MSLYPYNLYILLIALFVVIIYLIMTMSHVKGLLSSLKTISDDILPINEKAVKLQESLQKNTQKKKTGNIDVMKLLNIYILLKAVRKDYKKSPNKGLKQYRSSAYKVVEKKELNTAMRNVIKGMIS